MQSLLRRPLLFLLVLLAFQPLGIAQIRELGTGVPGPIKAPRLTAELIADPASTTRISSTTIRKPPSLFDFAASLR